ncbi:hypothetical protein OG21DRAFT_1318581 [Imleria badia]|nr:hypothetical protein OG21DRAFT_1318581 [Imleria badia]
MQWHAFLTLIVFSWTSHGCGLFFVLHSSVFSTLSDDQYMIRFLTLFAGSGCSTLISVHRTVPHLFVFLHLQCRRRVVSWFMVYIRRSVRVAPSGGPVHHSGGGCSPRCAQDASPAVPKSASTTGTHNFTWYVTSLPRRRNGLSLVSEKSRSEDGSFAPMEKEPMTPLKPFSNMVGRGGLGLKLYVYTILIGCGAAMPRCPSRPFAFEIVAMRSLLLVTHCDVATRDHRHVIPLGRSHD